MTLVKWQPRRNMFNIFDDVEKMVNQAFGRSMFNHELESQFHPFLNVNETDSAIEICIDLPGVEKKDVDVNVSNGLLSISGERYSPISESSDGRIWKESSYGRFNRTFELADIVDEDKIKAQFKNGVLKISLPKTEKVKLVTRNISIK
tara:strand:+ start:27 stop:470 length:444 start_codon:yes stop_codon:yes gene_type:complete